MSKTFKRKPFRNFFLLKAVQVNLIVKVFLIVVASCLCTSLFFSWFYLIKANAGTFYFLSNNIQQELVLSSFLHVILPPLIISQLITLIVGFAIGLFSSRKVAIPVYKIHKWLDDLITGNLTIPVEFREKDEMQELADKCNNTAGYYRSVFSEISSATISLEKAIDNKENVKVSIDSLKAIVQKINY